MNRRAALDEWISTMGRLAGLVFLVTLGVVWIFTQHVEPLLVASFGGLYGLSRGGEAIALLRRGPPAPPPLPDTTPPHPPEPSVTPEPGSDTLT